jgi:hypothetical protein
MNTFEIATLSLFLTIVISISIHEGAHALAARLLGFQIREIRIGRGFRLFARRFFETEFEIRLIPGCGLVRVFPPLNYKRSAVSMMIAAGPFIDVVCFVVLIIIYRPIEDRVLASAVFLPAILWQGGLLWGNLWPRYGKLYGAKVPNDGLSIWLTVMKKRDKNAAYRQQYLNLIRSYRDPAQPEPELTGQSERIAFHVFSVIRAWGILNASTVAALEREMARGLPACEELFILDTLATSALASQDCAQFHAHLDRWTERAIRLNPNIETVKSTRGSVLVEIGRHADGLAMLVEADRTNSSDSLLIDAFLALAYFRMGQSDAASTAFDMAAAALKPELKKSFPAKIMRRIAAEIGQSLIEDPVQLKIGMG